MVHCFHGPIRTSWDCFWPQVPNSLVKLTLTFGARVVTRGWELSKTNHGVQLYWPCTARIWS